jgi:hypothetical protein
MTQYVFGTGDLFFTAVAGSQPLKIGALQDVSVDFSSDVKQLYGQNQFPLDVARGKTKIEGKAASGNIDVSAFNSFFFGDTAETGETLRAINEPGTVPAMSTYTVTVDEAATFVQDLGVYDALTGEPLVQVASMPASGQYSVDSSTGVYTFNMAQASDDMLFNYLYESASTGNTMVINNQLMGTTPKFRLVLSQLYNGQTFTLTLYSCVAEKLSLPLKQDDYLIADFSFQAQANAAGIIGYMSTTG